MPCSSSAPCRTGGGSKPVGPPRKRILFLVLALCVARPGSLGASCSVSLSLSSAQRRGELRLRGGLGLRGEDMSLQGARADDSTAGMRGAEIYYGRWANGQDVLGMLQDCMLIVKPGGV